MSLESTAVSAFPLEAHISGVCNWTVKLSSSLRLGTNMRESELITSWVKREFLQDLGFMHSDQLCLEQSVLATAKDTRFEQPKHSYICGRSS